MKKDKKALSPEELIALNSKSLTAQNTNIILSENSPLTLSKDPIPLTIGMSMNKALQKAMQLPKMKQMFSTLLYENTLNIWGGDNGVGKSIAAFALAEHLARGWKFLGLKNECAPAKILLYDFELTLRGLLKRYSNNDSTIPYQFSPNFYRYDFNPNSDSFSKDYDDELFSDIRNNVKELQAKVLIIDNLSALKSRSNSDGDVALDLMNRLNKLKKDLDITIIVLTHITKLPLGMSMQKNHIAGSKHIQNLCDGIVGIGTSCQGDNKIYIKELKNRYEEEQYKEDNIIVCERIKIENFLTINFLDFDLEINHLGKEAERINEDDPKRRAIVLKKEGRSIGSIALELNKSKSTIHEWTKAVRSSEIPGHTERKNDQNIEDKSQIIVRSANEQVNIPYERLKYLSKLVLGEYTSREKAKIIENIISIEEVDELRAVAIFDSMIENELIGKLDSGFYYLTETGPY